ncbi:MAG: ExeM/NucH family extracellular endonuclease [Bacteroidota bacterium]
MPTTLRERTFSTGKSPVKGLKRLGTWCLFLFLLVSSTKTWAQPTELFISEYIEGSSNNKTLEIYNGTGIAINLATAGYSIQMFFNGSASAGLTINLTGIVASGEVFVLAPTNANATIIAAADQLSGTSWFNGDDAVVLRKGTTVIDVIGQIGFDPGTEWGTLLVSTADNTIRRKTNICAGDANGADAFNAATEWDGFATDVFGGLGSHTATCGTVTPTLSISDVSQTEGNAGTTNFHFTVSLSSPAGAGGVTFDIATADNTASSLTDYVAKSLSGQSIPAGSSTYNFSVLVNGDQIAEVSETFFVNVSNLVGANTADMQGQGTITNDEITVVKIHDVQGNGATSPIVGASVTIEGIVNRSFIGGGKLNGFYVQEEDAETDADPATSEGVFVFDPFGLFTGNIGDKVRVTGSVIEFTSNASLLTQISSLQSVTTLSTGEPLPAITQIQLPVSNVSDLERYEGMLVELTATSGNLFVTETFQLGRFGQLLISANGASNQPGTDARLDQYTQFNTPSVTGNTAYVAELAKRSILLDDGSGTQNNDPILFGGGGSPLSASNTLRGGDAFASVVGILDHRFEGYRIQTLTSPTFISSNPRPATAPTFTGSLKVASFNVLNYFNGNGIGDGFPTPRGATTAAEFARQRTKIINAITSSGADVIGLMEMENDGFAATSAIQDLVNGLNAVAGAGTYAFINSGSISSDEITVSLLYKPAVVSPVGASAAITGGTFVVVGRGSLAQTFQQVSTGEIFTAVVNHFKSKGSSSGGIGDADAGDGQGFSNGTRTRQANELATWLETNPTGTTDPDYIIMGDLNAYAKEDPIVALNNAGFNNLLPITSYSYVFDGQIGSLDHALGSSTISAQVTGAEKWHINADEPIVLDYNVEFKSAGHQTSLYSPEPFRASDHDPVLIGLELCTPPTITNVAVTQPNCTTFTGKIVITATGVGVLEYSINGTDWQESNTFEELQPASYTIIVRSKANPTCSKTYAANPVNINEAPLVPSLYTVSGGGGKCSGNNGSGVVPALTITLSGSQTGVNYQLIKNGQNVGSAVAGNGGSLTFVQTDDGTYTISATSAGGCFVLMSGQAIIYTNSRPEKFAVTGGGQLCDGSPIVIGLSSSQIGVNYLLKLNNVYTGVTVAGTGSAISFGTQSTGTYNVDAVNAGTGCDANMNGSAVIGTGKNCVTILSSINVKPTIAGSKGNWAQVAPNPMLGSDVNVLVKGFAGKKVSWNLVNAQGTVIANNRFIAASNAHREKLVVGNIMPGVYFLKLQSQENSAALKVLKID